eukprot:SAG31_NODE_1352_length_8668_cov_38.573229_5_plen_107_part_00
MNNILLILIDLVTHMFAQTKDVESKERRDSVYIFDLGDGLAVDARPRGNKTRRMNHSAEAANVRAKRVNHRGVRMVCMYAATRIAAGEELLLDYGPLFTKQLLESR